MSWDVYGDDDEDDDYYDTTTPPEPPKIHWVPIAMAADELKRPHTTIRGWVVRKKIRHRRFGYLILVNVDDLIREHNARRDPFGGRDTPPEVNQT